MEIETADSHIPSASAATAKLTQNQNPKGQNPLRLPFASFRLIFRLEKTGLAARLRHQRTCRAASIWPTRASGRPTTLE